MPDPWVTGDALKDHEKAVQEHELTKQAKELADQNEDLTKQLEERREERREELERSGLDENFQSLAQARPAAETGVSADAASGGIGPSGEAQAAPPAGNVESNVPTQEEQEENAEEESREEEKREGDDDNREGDEDKAESAEEKTETKAKAKRGGGKSTGVSKQV